MSFIKNLFRLNWIATIGINYRIGGMKTVMRMPVKVYGKLKWNLSGSIILPENYIRNTLIIGSDHEDYTASAGKAQIDIKGRMLINGIVRIGHDCFIGVEKDGVLSIGNGSFVGRDTQIHCTRNINIGNDVIMGETYMVDSDVHPITKDGITQPVTGTITIGEGTYLGFRTKLLKGTVIPPHSIVASGAVCTKDYSLLAPRNVLLAGVPATIKANNIEVVMQKNQIKV